MKKILLKLSGESLGKNGVSENLVLKVAKEIAAINNKGIAVAIVIGGGNIWRFRDNRGLTALSRTQSDFLGMLATVFNGTVLAAALQKLEIDATAFSAIAAPKIIEKYSITVAKKILKKGGVVVLAGGTGHPFVTTDTAAALRAAELKCDRVLKATNVDGVYSADPKHTRSAKLLTKLSFAKAIREKLGVMDIEAFRILRDNKIPLTVFNFGKKGLLTQAATRQNVGTEIK